MNEKELFDNERLAAQVLSNPAYISAITQYKADLFEAFTSSTDDGAEKREGIYRQMKCLRQVEKNLEFMIKTAKNHRSKINQNQEEL